MSPPFDARDLARLREEDEVEIKTTAGVEGLTHRAIIWVAVDQQDRVLIRSYRGPGARWFREITANPEARVHVQGHALTVRAMPATDPDRVAACSDGLRRKYAGHASMPGMLRQHLETTLELGPR
ncbi:MAG: nitroreductase family deazaflavin-dependent oxidoreductase [Chloroflexi bacterium]|nr:nitroreductase family deazaflavin-dependent oxidoreductase [Chloroflexota bacterium]